MGTRSITIVKNDGADIAYIYNQFDGYPTGIGADIKRAFDGKQLVNGYVDPVNHVNGMGDLAARLIVVFKGGKNEAGGTYLQAAPPDRDNILIEYIYTLEAINGAIHLTVESGSKSWSGPLCDFDPQAVESDFYGE